MRRGWRKPQFFSSCLGHVVGGSSPSSPIICGSSSIGRAPAFQAGCCEFKSRLSLHRLSRGVVNSARIERYIQQFYNRTCNPRVAGSSPARYSHWRKRQLSWQSRYICILTYNAEQHSSTMRRSLKPQIRGQHPSPLPTRNRKPKTHPAILLEITCFWLLVINNASCKLKSRGSLLGAKPLQIQPTQAQALGRRQNRPQTVANQIQGARTLYIGSRAKLTYAGVPEWSNGRLSKSRCESTSWVQIPITRASPILQFPGY